MIVHRFNLAIPEALFGRVKTTAKREYSTINAFIVHLLRNRIEAEETGIMRCIDGQTCFLHTHKHLTSPKFSTKDKS